MRRFPSGIAVVTLSLDGEDLGVTVGSLVSLSLDPPLIGVSIGLDGSLHGPMCSAETFALSLLSAEQEHVARHFALKGRQTTELLRNIGVRTGVTGAPLLEGALGWFECRKAAKYEVGDHTLFVGEVVALKLGRAKRALIYLGSVYRPA
jgi:flavin reductase (DIM6/NTAB) family NADH-FMN oxidoreductase RutF